MALIEEIGTKAQDAVRPIKALDQRLVRSALSARRCCLALQPVQLTWGVSFPAFQEAFFYIKNINGQNVPIGSSIALWENSTLGRDIDQEALRLGFQALNADPCLRLSLNASALSVINSAWLEALYKEIQASPDVAYRLIIEITETSEIPDTPRFLAAMREIKRHGVAFAIDDFGAGFTSFRYFQDYDFDIIKIDRRFVRNIHTSSDAQAIIKTLIGLARHFDMLIVAEGIEQVEEADCLTELGVDGLQGFYFGYPKPISLSPDLENII